MNLYELGERLSGKKQENETNDEYRKRVCNTILNVFLADTTRYIGKENVIRHLPISP